MCFAPSKKKHTQRKKTQKHLPSPSARFFRVVFCSSENTQVTAAAADIGSSELVGCPGDGWGVPGLPGNHGSQANC